MNPLDIDMIVECVLVHLATKQVAKCRQVCIRWEEVGTKVMKRRRDYQVKLNCQNGLEFTSLMKLSRNVPFTSIKWNCSSIDNILLDEVIEICGEMKNLVVDMSCNNTFVGDDGEPCCAVGKIQDNPKDAIHLVSKILRNLPHLQTLDFDDISPTLASPEGVEVIHELENVVGSFQAFQCLSLKKIIFPAEEQGFCSRTWKAIFTATPNVQEIQFNNQLQTTPVLTALVNSGRLNQLQRLRLENVDSNHLDVMQKSSMELKELRINIIDKSVGREGIERFLAKMSSSLEILALGSPDEDRRIRIKLPKMKQLVELGLFHCDDSLITLEELKWVEDTPELKTFSVSSSYRRFDWKDYFSYEEEGVIPCTTVEKLSLTLPMTTRQCCSYLGHLFPNVKSLALEFPKMSFLKETWTSWPDLTDLYIFWGVGSPARNMDIGLCGFPVAWRRSAEDLLGNNTGQDEVLGIREPTIKTGVSCLKKLQRLTLECTPPSPEINDMPSMVLLSDLSVYFSLVLLKDLRLVKIGRSQITPRAVRYLNEKLPFLSSIDIRGVDGPGVFSQVESQELVEYIRFYKDLGSELDDEFALAH